MFNKVILVGRLTADPERKTTGNDVAVINFSLAVDRPYKGEDGERKADFLNCTAWRQQADFICKYFHKGDPIGIEGNLRTRSYEDSEGNKRTVMEVQADNVFFVGGRAKSSGADATLGEEDETT